jgi:DNA-binding NtrC family response regulator
VTLETVRKHLTQEPRELPAGGFLTDTQYRYAVDNGLDSAAELFSYEVIRRNLLENNGNKSKTMAGLKISTNLLYARLKRYEPTGKEGRPDGTK